MLALFGNISGLEIAVILMLAVLIFGSRLPEVASRAYTQFRRVREAIDRFRRDTGIDQEMREIQRNVRDAAWREQLQVNLKAPEQDVMESSEFEMPAQNIPTKDALASSSGVEGDQAEATRNKDVGLAGPANDEDDAEDDTRKTPS